MLVVVVGVDASRVGCNGFYLGVMYLGLQYEASLGVTMCGLWCCSHWGHAVPFYSSFLKRGRVIGAPSPCGT
jgi:hypothetical protein